MPHSLAEGWEIETLKMWNILLQISRITAGGGEEGRAIPHPSLLAQLPEDQSGSSVQDLLTILFPKEPTGHTPGAMPPIAFWSICPARGAGVPSGTAELPTGFCSESPRQCCHRPSRGGPATVGSLTRFLTPPPPLTCLRPCLSEPPIVHLKTGECYRRLYMPCIDDVYATS